MYFKTDPNHRLDPIPGQPWRWMTQLESKKPNRQGVNYAIFTEGQHPG